MDCSQIIKYLLLDNILFNEGREDSCYSLPTLGNPWTFFKQGLAYKVLLSTMTTGVTLLLLSAVDNDTFFLFLMSQVLTMKLTELTNICYISDRVACTIKQNIKETFRKTMVLLEFSEKRTDSCYSINTLDSITLGIMLSKISIIKFGNPS